ncbi:MAG: tetratricopeptide repeat protein [Rhodanobacteraceae bacterium]
MSKQERSTGALPAAAIREQLQRMLVRPPFLRSPVLSRFLAHVVEHALGSDGPPLKEYAIGLEVFDRPDDFDPRIDTIVRVQARRLRAALVRYYKGEGRSDALRLSMPKGQYGIQVRHCDEVPDDEVLEDERSDQPRGPAFAAAPLPAARTPLIGRESELDTLRSILENDDVRMLTISGVGGSGKTRLALAVADAVGAAYPGGVLFLDLSAVTERAVLMNMLADGFNARHVHGITLLQAIVQSVRGKLLGPLLLVMDNMEGVLDAADVLGELLDASPLLTILATSRVALCLYGEHEFPLSPLAVPDQSQYSDDEGLAAVPAVQLFLMRAAAANPRAEFEGHMAALAELCVRLDGLPLAIELVAAQATMLTPEQMLQRFTGHLDLPENPARDAPSRQRTLRRTIDWSYDLLDEAGCRALRRLSVFAGGFTLEAAEAVADADGDLGADLMPALNTLVAMGLVYFRSDADEPRYAMLETLRAYGQERLAANNESDSVRKAHAAYCVVLAEEGVGALNAAQRERWLTRCDLEQENFRLAIEYLLRHGPQVWALRLGHALFGYWERREKLSQGGRLLERITQTVSPETDIALWGKVSTFTATLVTYQSGQVAARGHFQRLLTLYRRIGDPRGEAAMLTSIGVAEKLMGEYRNARECFAQALELCRRIGDGAETAACLSNVAECDASLGNAQSALESLTQARALFLAEDQVAATWCLNHLGDLARSSGDFDQAAELYLKAEAEFSRLGDRWGMARSLADRGRLALDYGNLHEAGLLLLQALASFNALGHRRGMATVVVSLAALALSAGQKEECIRLCAAAECWRADVGFATRQDDLEYQQKLLAQAGLEPAVVRGLQAAGVDMTAAEVIDVTQDVLATIPQPED